MKKTFTLIILGMLTVNTYAQRSIDLEISEILKPTVLNSVENSGTYTTPWPCTVVIKNNGTDTLKTGDSLLWAGQILDIATSQSIVVVPSNALSGGRIVSKMTRDLNPGDTFHFKTNITINAGLTYSRNVRVIFLATVRNGADPIANDPVTTNNSSSVDIIWYNIQGWAVSIDEVNYNNNISAFPNPADGFIMVSLLKLNFEEVKIELYDLTGKLVISEVNTNAFENNHYRLNTSDLEEGIYILKVSNGTEVSTTKVSIYR